MDKVLTKWKKVLEYSTLCLEIGNSIQKKPVIIVIPGNPGVASYYTSFIELLYQKLDGSLPIHCISHANHVTIPNEFNNGFNSYLDVETQIKHKLQYIQDNISQDTPIIFIGHSIGCYVILQMLKKLKKERVIKCILLFPTIRDMALTPNGVQFLKRFKLYWYLTPWLTNLFYYIFPEVIKRYMVTWFLGLNDYNKNESSLIVDSTLAFISSSLSVRNSLFMANDEMSVVSDLDKQLISENSTKLFFYYGTDDSWCPVQFYKEIRRQFSSEIEKNKIFENLISEKNIAQNEIINLPFISCSKINNKDDFRKNNNKGLNTNTNIDEEFHQTKVNELKIIDSKKNSENIYLDNVTLKEERMIIDRLINEKLDNNKPCENYIDINLCENNCKHAFVIKDNEIMSDIVSTFIRKHLNQYISPFQKSL